MDIIQFDHNTSVLSIQLLCKFGNNQIKNVLVTARTYLREFLPTKIYVTGMTAVTWLVIDPDCHLLLTITKLCKFYYESIKGFV